MRFSNMACFPIKIVVAVIIHGRESYSAFSISSIINALWICLRSTSIIRLANQPITAPTVSQSINFNSSTFFSFLGPDNIAIATIPGLKFPWNMGVRTFCYGCLTGVQRCLRGSTFSGCRLADCHRSLRRGMFGNNCLSAAYRSSRAVENNIYDPFNAPSDQQVYDHRNDRRNFQYHTTG